MKNRWCLTLLCQIFWLFPVNQPLWAQANFYDGKAVTITIGAKSGSLEIAALIVAHHLGKYIPGKPAVILQHMPGAAHLLATNNVYNIAKPDGLTILAANPNVAVAQLSKIPQARFDIRKFHWLGSSGADGVMFSIRPDLPYKSFDELKRADRELVAGTTGPGSNAHDFPLLLKEFAGAKLKLVPAIPLTAMFCLPLSAKKSTPGRRWRPPSNSPPTAAPSSPWCAAVQLCRAMKNCPSTRSWPPARWENR
ncbi:MAG: hypothetical protein FJ143_00675 [Deltaproteobacteria bacterium]|nr:hypothetical protein [Deltaproteobacteria bacterium]